MKTIHYSVLGFFLFLLFPTCTLFAQEEKTYYVTVTTMHRNTTIENFPREEWLAAEKEYFDKVVKKNELIIGSNVVTHYFTEDNSEILFVSVYENWEAIEKASTRSDELAKQAWPDEKQRTAFFEKLGSYYAHNHSDEIYTTVPGAIQMTKMADKPMIYYVRKSYFSFPKGGTRKEFNELNKQYLDAVTKKNEFIKAYYPYGHAWGSNSTDFVEVFVFETLGDIEKAFAKDDELFKAQWKDEKSQKEFETKINKYFTNTHSDFIYRSVPGLEK